MSFFTNLILILIVSSLHLEKSQTLIPSDKIGSLSNSSILNLNESSIDIDWHPIRIHVDYSLLYNNILLGDRLISAMKRIAEHSIKMSENLIKVKPLKTNLTIFSCQKFELPHEIQTIGVEADLIITLNYDNYTETQAYSSICNFEPFTGRPIGGIITFTKTFSLKENWLEYYTYVFFHELTHIMVFNQDLWSRFIDENGIKIPYENVVKTTVENNKTSKKIVTPRVLERARLHFNCQILDGIELEDKGGLGSIGLHWKARYMLTDYMVSNMYVENTISEITLAFFEDSGWYKVNYYTGGLFRFGKNQGCNFLYSPCIKKRKTLFPSEFCVDKTKPTCSSSRLFKGYCKVEILPNLQKEYNYFFKNIAGYKYTDYCPVSTPPLSNLMFLSSSCISGRADNYPPELEEIISSNSACFISSLINYKHSFVMMNYSKKNKSICYKYKCDFNNTLLKVYIGESIVDCPKEGGKVKLNGYSGILFCPDFNQICTKKEQCSTMIDCALNKVLGYSETYNYTYKTIYNEVEGNSVLIENVENMNNLIDNQYFYSNIKICIFILLLVMILTYLRSYSGLLF